MYTINDEVMREVKTLDDIRKTTIQEFRLDARSLYAKNLPGHAMLESIVTAGVFGFFLMFIVLGVWALFDGETGVAAWLIGIGLVGTIPAVLAYIRKLKKAAQVRAEVLELGEAFEKQAKAEGLPETPDEWHMPPVGPVSELKRVKVL